MLSLPFAYNYLIFACSNVEAGLIHIPDTLGLDAAAVDRIF